MSDLPKSFIDRLVAGQAKRRNEEAVLDAAREYAAACAALEVGERFSVTRINTAEFTLLLAAAALEPETDDDPFTEWEHTSQQVTKREALDRALATEEFVVNAHDCERPDRCCRACGRHVTPHRGCVLR